MIDDFKEMYQQGEDKDKASISVVMRLGDSYYIIKAVADGFGNIKTILFTHGKYGKYEFREESDGTKAYWNCLK